MIGIYVFEAMNKKPKTIGHSAKLATALKQMKTESIGSLIVVRREKPVGIITPLDFSGLGWKKIKNMAVKEVMKTDLVSVAPNDSLAYAAMLMTRRNIRRLPVIEDEKLVGIITAADMSEYYSEIVQKAEKIYRLRKSMGVGV